MYKAAYQRAKVKKQAIGGQDQFGAAHSALIQSPQSQQENGPTRLAANLDKYFGALSVSATTEKGAFEELVKANAALTTTNTEFTASVSILIKSN